MARFSVSRDGTLVYRTGESGTRLIWVDRSGRELETVGDPGESRNPALSPPGDRLAFNLSDPRGGKNDVWIRDLARGVSSRLTFEAGDEISPLWAPDGSRIVYANDAGGGSLNLSEKSAGGQGGARALLVTNEDKVPCDWSRDGRYIAFMSRGKTTNWDIWVLPTFGDRKPIPVLQTAFVELLPVFSPDGKWIAYQSNESGRAEIYVQGFPELAGKWQVSTAGGLEPRWSADGKQIYYRTPDQKLMTVPVDTGTGFQAGVPQPLFPTRFDTGLARGRYVPTADGQRFLTVAPLGREAMTPTTVVLNWHAAISPR